MRETEFDHPAYREITAARREWLLRHFPAVRAAVPAASAIEYGCGVGVFTADLQALGMSVLGLDLQPRNVREARERHPAAEFRMLNLDACGDAAFERLPEVDVAFAFGLLYHLESPLSTLRRMGGRTRHVMILETRTTPGYANALFLHQERSGAAHNTARVTAVPTLAALVTAVNVGGFLHVYRPDDQPAHAQWQPDYGNGVRHNLLAFRQPVDQPGWTPIPPPVPTPKWDPIR